MYGSPLDATPYPLHVLCACDTFKGTLPSDKVGEAVEAGYRQAWQKLGSCANERAHRHTTDTLQSYTLPSVTLPPPYSADVKGVQLTPIAAELLAKSFFAHPHQHHYHHCENQSHQQSVNQPTSINENGERMRENTSIVNSQANGQQNTDLTASMIPVDFSHSPMSDGGAGLIDSVTFAASLEAQQTKQKETGKSVYDHSTSTTASALTDASAAGGAAVVAFHAPPIPSEALQLHRVYVPASTVITGPLGAPISHIGEDGSTSSSAVKSRVSFACDVARRVLVVEMAEAAGLPRIEKPQDRNPMRTTSYGVGELIRYALHYMEEELHEFSGTPDGGNVNIGKTKNDSEGSVDHHQLEKDKNGGVRLFLGIGGSSTNDGGLGALQALGLQIFVQPTARETRDNASLPTSTSLSASASEAAGPAGSEGTLLDRPFCGGDLGRITHVRISDKMLQLFPYLQNDPANFVTASDEDNTNSSSLFISEVCLICDVDNALVGPHGATYTFGPQKCAPPPPPLLPASIPSPPSIAADRELASCANTGKHSSSDHHRNTGDDTAVGAVTSAGQQVLLDTLEAGMRHAAMRVVASTWHQLVPRAQWSHVLQSATVVALQGSSTKEVEEDVEAAVRADLLSRPGGGGAGGMSGFFRYVLKAIYVPGADVVGGLLGLYETPRVARLLGSDDREEENEKGENTTSTENENNRKKPPMAATVREYPLTLCSPAVCHPRGRLFHACDVVVSGEGSFDDQSISSHKTVGRLLEMCTAANAYRLWKHYCHISLPEKQKEKEKKRGSVSDLRHQHCHCTTDLGCRKIQEFIIVCGRTNFEDYASCQSSVLKTVCSTLLLPMPSGEAATTSKTSEGEENANESQSKDNEAGCNPDIVRVNIYLQELLKSSAFRTYCDGHRPAGPTGTRESSLQNEWSAAHILRHFCVPHVTVLPLTPTLFSFTDATQRAYACVTAAVADLLEDSARRIAEQKEKGAAVA